MEVDLVTIATFDNPVTARIVANRLEAEGIAVHLADETTVSLFWNLSNAIGGIKLQVASSNADRALEVLDAAAPEEPAAEEPAPDDPDSAPAAPSLANEEDEKDEEPENESTMDSLRRMKGILWLFLIGPLIAIVVGVLVVLVSAVIGLFF